MFYIIHKEILISPLPTKKQLCRIQKLAKINAYHMHHRTSTFSKQRATVTELSEPLETLCNGRNVT